MMTIFRKAISSLQVKNEAFRLLEKGESEREIYRRKGGE